LARRLASAILFLGILLGPFGAKGLPLGTADAAVPSQGHIIVVKVSGLIDPINADLIRRAVHDAEQRRATVLVMQLNSTGGVISPSAIARLLVTLHASTVPVTVWVGGSGRPRADGQAYQVLRASAYSGVAPGAQVGASPVASDPMNGRRLGAQDAVAARVVSVFAPTLGDFIVGLDGRSLGGHNLSVARVVQIAGQPRRELLPGVDITFSELTIFPRLLHSAASPNVAFAMLIIALSLAVFEFFTAGVGVAAATAAVAGILAAYGLGVLPTRPWAAALIALGIFGFAIDVQSGAPRVWTIIGTGAMAAGSFWLYVGPSVSPWVFGIMGVLAVVFMVSGMPAMVRTRFSTPTIGREAMVGAMGVAVSGVDPEGTVEVNGAPWRARTNRATPIIAGAPVRVAGIDGLVLEVEPEHGAAADYRH
jgi:membrane-bound serine protease (ClpP class)